MRPILTLLISLLIWGGCSPLRAQPGKATGQVVGVDPVVQPCLLPDERTAIQRMLQTKLALLKRNNRLPAQQPAAHPLFSFPLRWAKTRAPYGFWSISNYVDLNPTLGPDEVNQYSPSNRDYTCGNRTYDQKGGYQHQGTDFALWPFNWSVMANEEVKVVAAAPGTIIYRQDGNDDQSCGSFATASGTWNAVYVRHDDGSVAWYGHLKKGSVTPKSTGQRVNEGDLLGYVGSSGRSSGPHLHFEVYDANNKLIDPFAGSCNPTTPDSWWKEQPVYKEKVLNRLSVHTTQPVTGVCPPSANATNEVVMAAPGQRFYFYAFGRELEPSDPILFDLYQPDGRLFTNYRGFGTTSYTTFFWYMYTTLPANAVEGKWKLRVRFNGKEYDKSFVVVNNPSEAVKLTALGSPVVCAGKPVTLRAATDSDDYVWKKDGAVIDTALGRQLTVNQPGLYTAEIGGIVSNPISVSVGAALAAPTVAKTTVELCQGATAQPLEASGTNLKWTDPNGVSSTTAPVPSTTLPTPTPEGNRYTVTQTGANGCESLPATIRVLVQTVPTLSLSGSTTVNLGIEVPLRLTFSGAGPYRYRLTNGLTGTATNDTTLLLLPEQTTTYQVVELSNRCGSGQPGNGLSATVTVRVPTIQTLVITTTTVCAGASLPVQFLTSGQFNPGSVFKLQVGKVEIDTNQINYVEVPGSQPIDGQIVGNLPTPLAAGQYRVRVMATNPKIPINGERSPTLLTVRPLATATLTGNLSVYAGQSANLMVALTGEAPWQFTYHDSTATGLGTTQTVQTSASPYGLVVKPVQTTAYRLTSVSTGCGNGTVTAGLVVVSVVPLLGLEDQALADAVDVYPIPATTLLTVRVRGLTPAQSARLELIDQTGRTAVQHETRRETSVLSLGGQPAGTYILRIRVGDRLAAKRIVKL